MSDYEIVSVTSQNLDRYDLFCKKSKPKEAGYTDKVAWFQKRHVEGLRLQLLLVDEGKKNKVSRGFIEYIPGEYAWRAINASGWLFVHCLWVVGRNKGKGYGTQLLETCLQDARENGFPGVAMLVTGGNFLAKGKLPLSLGFEVADEAQNFQLLAKRVGDTTEPLPSLPTNWEERAAAWGDGITVLHTSQCPYNIETVETVRQIAEEQGVAFKEHQLTTATEVQELSPTPAGTFALIKNGELRGYYPHTHKQLAKMLA
ncbi:GNAT family N-acetyltransferase [bacterium]|nr:GNAT family N-acetyltransferase [bacterium]